MKKKNKKIIKKTSLAKSLGELMKDEDGFVSKETILKVGMSTIAALGIMGGLVGQSGADCPTHTNVIDSVSGSSVHHSNYQTAHASY